MINSDAQSGRRVDDQCIPALQREDNDMGSGEDFSVYTGAKERIHFDAAA